MKSIKSIFYSALILCFLFSISACQNKQDQEKQQVKKFLKTAVAYIHQHGEKAAIAEFNKEQGLFSKGYLYVFAYNYKGVCLANGDNPKLAGRELFNLKDSHGKFIIRNLTKIAKAGGGWGKYYWHDPVTNTIEKKESYILPVNDHLFIGAGYYVERH